MTSPNRRVKARVLVAASRASDAPTATPNVTNGGWYDGPVDVVFGTDEPADVHYTTDGSTPTQESAVVEARRVRDAAEPIEITETTTLRWIAVDAAGNVSEPKRVKVRIR